MKLEKEQSEQRENPTQIIDELFFYNQRSGLYTHISTRTLESWKKMDGKTLIGLYKKMTDEIKNHYIDLELISRRMGRGLVDVKNWLKDLQERAGDNIGEAMGTTPVAEGMKIDLSKKQVGELIENVERARSEVAAAGF